LGDIPERVFECAMAEIKPAAINSVWYFYSNNKRS
jgi:hypothetical protein